MASQSAADMPAYWFDPPLDESAGLVLDVVAGPVLDVVVGFVGGMSTDRAGGEDLLTVALRAQPASPAVDITARTAAPILFVGTGPPPGASALVPMLRMRGDF